MPRPVTLEKEDESFAEQTAIAATLERHISGARTGDVGLMRVVFVATARISGTYDGKPVEWTVEEFCGIVERGGPAEGLEAQIVAIEYVGNAGMARLEARNWRGTRYTDFFVLSKQAENWRINSKVFYAHSRAYKRRAWTEANMFEYRLERHCQINFWRANRVGSRMHDHLAATASRHWFAASIRKIRSVERETRWR